MGLIADFRKWLDGPEERSMVYPPMLPGVDEWWPFVNMGGNTYGIGGLQTSMPGSRTEEPAATFQSFVSAAYKANGIIFACELARIQIFSQARFQWQALRKGKPDNLYGTPALDILAKPWPGGTTGDLLTRMLIHADFGGNAFVTRRPSGIKCLRPDWVVIVHGSPNDEDVLSDDIDAELLGYVYYPGGKGSGRPAVTLLREEVAHFAPIPDPLSPARGMSWLTPIVREVMGDGAATNHKLAFFEHSGTPQMIVVRPDAPDKAKFDEWRKLIDSGHAGQANAYKTLYLTAGADATVVGRDLQQLDFKVVQGAGETRIAAAAGVHPVIVGLSEGMQGSSLNAGNFNSARRLTADKTLWHLWSNVAGSLEMIAPPPAGSRLWIDPNIAFLREDVMDTAEIRSRNALTIESLIRGGFTPDTARDAVVADDFSLLKHTGLFSVQLQPPGTEAPDPAAPVEVAPPKPTNGTKPAPKPTPTGGAA